MSLALFFCNHNEFRTVCIYQLERPLSEKPSPFKSQFSVFEQGLRMSFFFWIMLIPKIRLILFSTVLFLSPLNFPKRYHLDAIWLCWNGSIIAKVFLASAVMNYFSIHLKNQLKKVSQKINIYRIVTSTSQPRFEAHAGLFKLVMKGIFDVDVLWPFHQKCFFEFVTRMFAI